MLLKPELEGDKCPNVIAEINPCCAMCIEKFFDSFFPKESPVNCFLGEECLVGVIFKFVAEPGVNGDTESHLGAKHDFVWDESAKRFLENIFLVIASLEFEMEGNFGGEFEHLVVEERRAPFKGDDHAGDVDFCHECIRKVGDEIGVDGAFGSISRSGSRELIGDDPIRIEGSRFRFEFVGIERILHFVGEVADIVHVAEVVRF